MLLLCWLYAPSYSSGIDVSHNYTRTQQHQHQHQSLRRRWLFEQWVQVSSHIISSQTKIGQLMTHRFPSSLQAPEPINWEDRDSKITGLIEPAIDVMAASLGQGMKEIYRMVDSAMKSIDTYQASLFIPPGTAIKFLFGGLRVFFAFNPTVATRWNIPRGHDIITILFNTIDTKVNPANLFPMDLLCQPSWPILGGGNVRLLLDWRPNDLVSTQIKTIFDQEFTVVFESEVRLRTQPVIQAIDECLLKLRNLRVPTLDNIIFMSCRSWNVMFHWYMKPNPDSPSDLKNIRKAVLREVMDAVKKHVMEQRNNQWHLWDARMEFGTHNTLHVGVSTIRSVLGSSQSTEVTAVS